MTRSTCALLGFMMLSLDAAAAQQPADTFVVGTARATRGTTAFGAIEVPSGSDSGLSIPVAVINGVRAGPVVALIAGTHGTEYSTVIAMQRIIGRIDGRHLGGAVIVLPAMNVPSFVQMVPRTNPTDGKMMVYGYPGDRNGSQSMRAMAFVTDQVIARSDVIVDLHGGDFDENIRAPYAAVLRFGRPAQDAGNLELARAFGLDHIAFFDRDASDPRIGSSLTGQALSRGKRAVLVAAGRSGIVTEDDIEIIIRGSMGVLMKLGMLPGHSDEPARVDWLQAVASVTAPGDGAFFATVAPNQHVKKGERVGYMTDLLGRKTQDIDSPVDGLVVLIRGVPSAWKNATLAEVFPEYEMLPPWRPTGPR